VVIVLVLWAVYVVTQTLVVIEYLSETAGAAIGLGIGAAAVIALVRGGVATSECFLRIAPLSGRGALALLPVVILWPFILSTGEYLGPDLGRATVGILGSVAQELFFRSALLPTLLFLMQPRAALLIHTLAFGVWHAGALLVAGEMLVGALAIIVVSLVAGYAWGWQTIRDRTVMWAMVHHSLLWIVGSLFDLSPPT
jgi:membrane protease YdiL (CAAX protease family)